MRSNYKNLLYTVMFALGSLGLIFFKYQHDDQAAKKEPAKFPAGYEIAAWEWKSPNEPGIIDQINKLSAQGVNEVYVDIGGYIDLWDEPDSPQKNEAIEIFTAAIKEYIAKAQANGIYVQALAGGPKWATDSYKYIAPVLVNYVAEFNAQNSVQAFTGLQFDIEPHAIPDFDQHKAQYLTQYLDLVQGLVTQLNALQAQNKLGGDFRFGLAIPAWFDNENGNVPPLDWHGENKTVFKFLLNALNKYNHSYIALMAYRDSASDTIAISKKQIQFAQQYQPRIDFLIGREASDIQPRNITYYGKGINALKNDAKQIALQFQDSDNFKGFAINDTSSFIQLKDE